MFYLIILDHFLSSMHNASFSKFPLTSPTYIKYPVSPLRAVPISFPILQLERFLDFAFHLLVCFAIFRDVHKNLEMSQDNNRHLATVVLDSSSLLSIHQLRFPWLWKPCQVSMVLQGVSMVLIIFWWNGPLIQSVPFSTLYLQNQNSGPANSVPGKSACCQDHPSSTSGICKETRRKHFPTHQYPYPPSPLHIFQ